MYEHCCSFGLFCRFTLPFHCILYIHTEHTTQIFGSYPYYKYVIFAVLREKKFYIELSRVKHYGVSKSFQEHSNENLLYNKSINTNDNLFLLLLIYTRFAFQRDRIHRRFVVVRRQSRRNRWITKQRDSRCCFKRIRNL